MVSFGCGADRNCGSGSHGLEGRLDRRRYESVWARRSEAESEDREREGNWAMRIRLTNVAHVIARCWTSAEERTRALVQEKYGGPSEEFITFLFCGELRVIVETASQAR